MSELFTERIIDKNLAVPLYFQLYSYIEKAIDEGKLVDGDRLPTEDELVACLHISRPTVRQAYKELSTKGYVKRERSKGTVVTRPKILDKFLTELTSFRNELESRGSIQTTILEFGISENMSSISEILNCDKCVHLRRLRYCDGSPVVYVDSYLPYEQYKELLDYDMEKESLYSTMKELGKPVISVRRNISAGLPDKKVAQYLQISAKTPVVISKTIGKNAGEEPVEYSVAMYSGEKASFQIDLKLKDIEE